jgi:hypothetical protein
MNGIGQVLRDARRGAGIQLEQAAWATRLRENYLDALENDAVDSLGLDPAYVRGTVRTYADYLGLDGERLVARHRADDDGGGDGSGPRGRRRVARLLAGLLGVAAVAVLAFAAGVASAGGTLPWSLGAPGAAAPGGTEDDVPAGGGDDAPDARDDEAVLAAPAPTPLKLKMEFLDEVWVRGETDGEEVFEGIYEPGQVERLEADDEITLRLGVGGAIEFTLNGAWYGALAQGRSGPVDLVCDADDGCRVAE